MKTPDYDLLKTLIAVAESKNFVEAAAKLKISQPAVSFKLKELETQSPLPLFQLEGKRKVLTHFGRALYGVALKQSKSMETNLSELYRLYSSPELLTLRLGGRVEVLEYLAPRINFAGKVELISSSSTQAVERLLAHEVDIAISYSRPDSTEIIAKRIFQSSSHLVVHEKFLKNKKLNLDLAKEETFLTQTPCVLYYSDGHMLKDWINYLNVPFEELKVRFVAEDWRSVQTLVDQGLGYALVPEYIKSNSKQVQRIELPAQPMTRFIFYALFEKDLKKVKAFESVLEFKQLRQPN